VCRREKLDIGFRARERRRPALFADREPFGVDELDVVDAEEAEELAPWIDFQRVPLLDLL